MRTRAAVAAVTGALALSAVAVPTAMAGSTGTPYALDFTFSGVKVNNGRPIVVGPTAKVTAPVTYQVTHSADVDLTAKDVEFDVELYRGAVALPANELFGDNAPSCTAVSATLANCRSTIDIYPAEGELTNADATTFKALGYAFDWNDQDPYNDDSVDWSKVGYVEQDALTTTRLQRHSKLTVNASPEPVKKGRTLTVTGKLSRANWEDNLYHGYAGQYVKLQFRKSGTSTYTTLKTVKTNTYGNLSTTVTAATDGYFRYSFAGTSTTAAVSAAGDYVDVQ